MPEITTSVNEAASAIRAGRQVAFPTETVYGLGANARDDDATRGVFTMKGRPFRHPLIVHLLDAADMAEWASEVPDVAWKLAESLMPGPLTLVLRRRPGVGELAAGGHPSIALRVPVCETTRELLENAGTDLVAPSANRFGRPSPTSAQHVAGDFRDTDLLILDGGPTRIGIESTIVDLTDPNRPAMARPGAIDRGTIENILGIPALCEKNTASAPGGLPSHYSPRQRLLVLGKDDFPNCVRDHPGEVVAALGFARPAGLPDSLWERMDEDPVVSARGLFAAIRRLEATQATLIVACQVPNGGPWAAIADRLAKAAG